MCLFYKFNNEQKQNDMKTTEVLPLQQWELTTDNVLFTINEQGKLISFKKGKICKVHGSGETIEAYWLDDIWKPITISKDEFVKYFKKISCTND